MIEDFERNEDSVCNFPYILSNGIARYGHLFPNPLAAQLEARPNFGEDVLHFERKGLSSLFSMSFAEIKAAHSLVESLEAMTRAAQSQRGRAR